MKSQLLKLAAGAVFSILSFSQSSSAAVMVVDGKCTSVTAAKGCLFKGNINTSADGNNSYLEAQAAYNLYNNTHASAAPDIFLKPIIASDAPDFAKSFGGITGAGSTSGTWSLNGFLVNYIGVKSGSNFILYGLTTPSASGSWTTADLPGIKNGPNKGNPQALSHLTFFGNPVPVSSVPEPSTWAMMIMGIGFVGSTMRRRKAGNVVSRACAA
jgi:hypothetical protein